MSDQKDGRWGGGGGILEGIVTKGFDKDVTPEQFGAVPNTISIKGFSSEGDMSELYKIPEEASEVDDLTKTLNLRQPSHGDFTDNARVMQGLKQVARSGNNWLGPLSSEDGKKLTPVQCEALDMILHKIGRIVTGNPNVADHWLDIEGYARLARERLENDPYL